MTEGPHGPNGSGKPEPGGESPPSPADIWRDWVTIWQSELSAAATDREAQIAWAKLVALWAAGARAAGAFLPDGAPGRPGASSSARSTPADSAPDARDIAIERLASRVAELERRLAGLGSAPPKP